MKTKLSAAQKTVLLELCAIGEFRCIKDYKPAQKLVALGLAVCTIPPHGHMTLKPTTSGTALANELA